MAKKSKASARETPSITTERAARLSRLLHLIESGQQTRAQLLRRLRIDVRGFYRDLQFLRSAGIEVELQEGRYRLKDSLDESLKRLPLPDPRLTVGEAEQLSKGRTAAHQKLKGMLSTLSGEK